MSNSPAPKSAKWPFLLGDLLLVAAAGAIVAQGRPLGAWQAIAVVAAVALGAWILIQPFLKDQDIAGQLEELNRLGDTVKQINKVEEAADRIGRASSNWQGIQSEAAKTLESITGISDRMSVEAEQFSRFIQRQNDTEKATLRLETEKLRRSEGEWLQVSMRMLDHVFALFAAAPAVGPAECHCPDRSVPGHVPRRHAPGGTGAFRRSNRRALQRTGPSHGRRQSSGGRRRGHGNVGGRIFIPGTTDPPGRSRCGNAGTDGCGRGARVGGCRRTGRSLCGVRRGGEWVEAAPVNEEPEVTLADSDPVKSMPEAEAGDPRAGTKPGVGQSTLF